MRRPMPRCRSANSSVSYDAQGDRPEADRMQLTVTTDREDAAEIPELPGVMVYGATKSEARAKAGLLALRMLADQPERVA